MALSNQPCFSTASYSLMLLFTLVAAGVTAAGNDINDPTDVIVLGTTTRPGKVFLEATKAKAFIKHREKRIWWWWEQAEEKEESKEGERRRETNHRNYLARTCPANCWGTWSKWSSCTSPCGNDGYKTARRSRAPPSGCRDWVNRNGCPGLSSKRVPCNRLCNNGGSPRAGHCSCKPGFYGTCCPYRVTCSFPGRPTNGAVTPSSGRSNFGTVARFSCSGGYRLLGSSTRTCQTNGQWSGATPRCNIISCPNPGIPTNGQTIGRSFQYGSTVVFKCNTGYILTGSSSVRCLATARWSHAKPTCQPIRCPALSSPTGGRVRVSSTPLYRSVATYSCNTGYYMVGPRTRTCQASGRWDGSDTKCSRTTCSDLPRPQNGYVNYSGGRPRYYGQRALYACRSGYRLMGSASRTCAGYGSRGTWSGAQPSCTALSCGDPGRPTGGQRFGSAFTYLSSVTFRCLPGHYIRGSAKITCLHTGRWSAGRPTCIACAVNYYKTGSSDATSCTRCQAHSHTAGQGSTTIKQCVCDRGFRGNPGGPCTQIRCPSLIPPKNGQLSSCNATVDGACNILCNKGYIRSSGDGVRKCNLNGKWSGSKTACSACPKDTYEESDMKCVTCSPHSHTTGNASVRTDCVCDKGFSGPPGGLCSDVNECESGNGGCEQKCDNTVGSFRCFCNIPGFRTDNTSAAKCEEHVKCPAFPTPANGGAVCNRILAVNTRRCRVKCNHGYDHLESPQEFEECGPNTGWKWSFEVAGREITSCIAQTFEGISMEATVFYFDDKCGTMTTAQRQELRKQFVTMLQAQGLCKFKGQKVCNIDQVRVECGDVEEFDDWLPESMRKKRSADSERGKRVLKISFAIDVPPVAVRNVNCGRHCGKTPVDSEACRKTCREKYMDDMNSTVNKAGEKLKTLFQSSVPVRPQVTPAPDRPANQSGPSGIPSPEMNSPLALTVGGRTLLPASPNVKLGDALKECKPGAMYHKGFCLPCDRGSMWNEQTKKCTPCPPGTHAPRVGLTRCLHCPLGYTASNPRATECVAVAAHP